MVTREWTDAVLQNGWAVYDATTPNGWGPAQFWKDAAGVVHLRGLIKSGTTTPGTLLLTLPVGCRPGRYYLFPVLSFDLLARIDVFTDGSVKTGFGANANWISLNGVSFLAEA